MRRLAAIAICLLATGCGTRVVLTVPRSPFSARQAAAPRPEGECRYLNVLVGYSTQASGMSSRDVSLSAEVAEALRRVPDEFRAALVLADVEDLPYAEIAAVLDVAVGTVKSRVHRGRVALARAMGLGGEPDGVSRPSEEEA